MKTNALFKHNQKCPGIPENCLNKQDKKHFIVSRIPFICSGASRHEE
jgi:hypothetical protein